MPLSSLYPVPIFCNQELAVEMEALSQFVIHDDSTFKEAFALSFEREGFRLSLPRIRYSACF